MILLCVGLVCTSTVLALLIPSPQSIQPPGTELASIRLLSNDTITHVRINESLLTLPTGESLDQGHKTSMLQLNLSAGLNLNCDEGWGRGLNLQMCQEALASIPWVIGPVTRLFSFGPREANMFDIGLPRRYMSCGSLSCYCGHANPKY